MKKFLTILVFLLGSNLYAQTTTVSADNVTAVAGENVNVSINVQNFVNVGAITIKIQYNQSVLTWIEALNWDIQLSDGLANAVNGEVIIAWDGLTGVNINNGKLVDLKFLYNGGSTGLDFIIAQCEIADVNGNIISVSYVNGSVNPINLIDVTVNTSPAGRSFTVDGSTFTTQQVFSWQPGSNHTIATTSPQNGTTGTRYVWVDWSDGGAMTHTITAPSNPTTYTANFNTEYELTMSAEPSAGGTVSPGNGWHLSGAQLQIEATENSGYYFTSWTGNGSGSYTGSNNPEPITMSGPISETANFSMQTGITVATNPTGRSITVDGTTYTAPQTFSWTPGTQHTVETTSPQNGTTGTRYVWVDWSDGGAMTHTITAPSNPTTYTANFNTEYELTMSAEPSAGGTVSPGNGWHLSGAQLQIEATENSGYYFTSWTGNGSGSYTGSNNPEPITMSGPISETANFSMQTGITVATNPTGRSITVDGTTYTAPQTFSWTPGTQHTVETTSPQNGTTGTRYVWVDWSDGGAMTHTITAPSNPTTYTANFNTEYELTMSAEPSAGGTVSPGNGWHLSGAQLQIEATENSGYYFTSWTGNGSGSYTGSNNPEPITMSGPISETANFSMQTGITVATNPTGRSITVDGTTYTAPQTFSWTPGTQHTVETTSPQNGTTGTRYVWVDWSDGGAMTHTITAPSNPTTYTANFNTEYELTMSAEPSAGGTVSPGNGWHLSGAQLQIEATENSGYYFTSWTGNGSGSYTGSNNPEPITMSGPISETANFSMQTGITVATNPTGRSITVDGTTYTAPQTFSWTPGTQHTVETTSPQNGTTGTRYVWVDWSDGGAMTHTITAPSNPTTYTANFNTEYELTMSAEPSAGGTVSPGNGWHLSGAQLQIEATENSGYYFTSWTGNGSGSYTGSNNPEPITMSGPISETANFSMQTGITVATNPTGRSITVDGTTYTAPQTFSWTPGTQHTVETTSPQNGTTGTRYVWVDWSDGGAMTHTITAPSNPTTYTANFNTEYELTMSAEPSAGGTVSPGNGWHLSGAQLQIEATENSGYYFTSWTGNGSGSYTGSNNPEPITMSGPISETANFSMQTGITVATNPTGRSITVDGTTYTAPQTFSWTPGTQHTVETTSPQNGTTGTRYVWVDWSDGGAMTHTITAPSNPTTYTANFNTEYELTMSAEPSAGGTVSPGNGWHLSGAQLQIEATENSGYYFTSWTGNGSGSYTGSNNPVQITMNEPIEQTASFNFNVLVIVNTSPAGRSFTVDGSTFTTQQIFSWQPGSNHTIATTSPQNGTTGTRYVWVDWSDGGAMTHTITAPSNPTTYTANFNTEYELTMSAEPSAGGTVSPGNGWHLSGAQLQIEATENSGYYFTSWTGNGSGSYTGSNNPEPITMSGPISETANFSMQTGITVATNPTGRSITVDGTTYTAPQTFSWTPGTQHTVETTSPQNGTTGTRYVWVDWSDGGAMTHTITAPSNPTTYTANFNTEYELTMSAEPSAGGTVSPGNGWHLSGAQLQIEATENSGYYFTSWTGNGSGSYTGSNNPEQITMNEPIEQTASFNFNVLVIVNTSPAGRSFTVDGSTFTTQQIFSWQPGSNHTIATTSPQNGTTGTRYVWVDWSDGGAMTHTITAPSNPTTYTANFNTEYELTMSAEPSAGGTVSPGNGWHLSGAQLQIEATENSGYYFTSWTGNGSGSYTGSNNPEPITMSGPISETANFSMQTGITVATNPTGRSITVDGTTYTAPQTFSWTPGTQHTVETTSPQNGTTGTRYVWVDWSDGGAMTHTITAPSNPTTYTANFNTEYELTMSAEPSAGGTVSPGNGWHLSGAQLQIEATENSGYYFTSWTGNGSGSYTGSNNPEPITMSGPISETANFSMQTGITVATNPTGRSITVDGTTYTAPQTFSWTPGTQHTVETTSPQNGTTGTRYVWVDWSDGGAMTHTITAPSNPTTYTANFNTEYELTMSAEPSAGGTVSPGNGWHLSGAQLQIEATENSGYYFTSWTGNGSGSYTGSNNPEPITMSGPISETANFSMQTGITVATNPTGRSITVDGTTYTAPQTFSWTPGTQHTVETTSPQNGTTGTRYVWVDWSDGGAMTHTITAPSNPTTYTANFNTEYELTMSAEPSAGGTVSPGNGWHLSGAQLQIEATENSGYYFTSWTGNGSGSYTGSNNPEQITMNEPIEQTASFNFNVLVIVNTSPAGRSFTVDDTTYTTQQVFSWQPGSNHTIATVSPQSGGTGTQYLWTDWSDDGNISHSVSPTVNTTYTANFNTEYYLTMTSGTGGSVTPSSGWRGEEESIQIEAFTNAGYNFAGWTGTGSDSYTGNNNPATITINGPISETAYFELIAIEIPLDPVPPLEALPGDIITVKIDLGSTSHPVSDLQIISFELLYSNTPPPTIINYADNFTIGGFWGSNIPTVVNIPDDPNGKLNISMFILGGSQSGHGTIISLDFMVSSSAIEDQTIDWSFGVLSANNLNGDPISIQPGTASTTIILEGLEVWSGDTDNNGTVQIIDINPIITRFGLTGPSCPHVGCDWIGRICPPWSPISDTYIDVNGNGQIDITDINCVVVNIGNTHPVTSKPEYKPDDINADPPLTGTSPSSMNPGEEYWVEITVGDATLPVTDMKVLSFDFLFDNTQFIDYVGYEIGSFMSDAIAIVIPADTNGIISASLFNLSQGYTGHGVVMRFNFVVQASTPLSPEILITNSWGAVQANRTDGSDQPLSPQIFTYDILPVELVSFSASSQKNNVLISWETATETNNYGFEVERQVGSIEYAIGNWEKIGFVDGHGNSNSPKTYQYTDDFKYISVKGIVKYRLKQIDFIGSYQYSDIIEVDVDFTPKEYVLFQNYPNPFNPITKIKYSLPRESDVTITVFDVLGNEVVNFINENQEAGTFEVNFDGTNLVSGIYIYQIRAGTFSQTKKMLLIK